MENLHIENLASIGEKLKNGDISPVDLVSQLFQRIDAVDPILNAFITINREEVLAKAKKVENEIKQGKHKGALHGVPIGIKDNIFTNGIKTTMGSEIYESFVPDENAFVVDRLEEAGAIIIGKLNTHQFAYGPTGDRSHYGPVRNPYDTSKMTGGSSSGSAAAVSACFCYGALGTDTGGSVRIPSSFCGIVGMKPTYGRISKRGVYPLSWTLDHVGPMTRTVMDNAVLLNAISGYDENDTDMVVSSQENFTRFIGESIKGKIIGIPNHFFNENVDEEITRKIEETVKAFESVGAKIMKIEIPKMDDIELAQRTILRSEAYAIHEKNLEEFPHKWDDEVKERAYTGLEVKAFELANAHQIRKAARKEFNRILEKVDALLTPTMAIMPPEVNSRYIGGDTSDDQHIRWTILKFTSPFNLLGLPSLSVPVGFSSGGMPIGAQLVGKDFSEATLYQLGYAIEQKLNVPTAKTDIVKNFE